MSHTRTRDDRSQGGIRRPRLRCANLAPTQPARRKAGKHAPARGPVPFLDPPPFDSSPEMDRRARRLGQAFHVRTHTRAVCGSASEQLERHQKGVRSAITSWSFMDFGGPDDDFVTGSFSMDRCTSLPW